MNRSHCSRIPPCSNSNTDAACFDSSTAVGHGLLDLELMQVHVLGAEDELQTGDLASCMRLDSADRGQASSHYQAEGHLDTTLGIH